MSFLHFWNSQTFLWATELVLWREQIKSFQFSDNMKYIYENLDFILQIDSHPFNFIKIICTDIKFVCLVYFDLFASYTLYIKKLLLKSVSKLHANTSIPHNDESWSSIEQVTPFGTMPQWVNQSASYNSSTGKCALLQA